MKDIINYNDLTGFEIRNFKRIADDMLLIYAGNNLRNKLENK
jgi:hypothetical protein